jgi:hypothetical protein
LLPALAVVGLGSAAFFSEAGWILRVLVAVILIPGGIWLLQAMSQLGRPVITLTRAGFRTASSPDIPWRLVDGVNYSETKPSSRDSEALPYGTLTFSIPTLLQEASRFSLIGRLTHVLIGKQSRVMVTLRNTSEPPGAVGRLAERLWTQSTGRANDWNPYASEAFNAANRELGAAHASIRQLMASGDIDPVAAEKLLAKVTHNSDILMQEGRRMTRQGYWAVAILVLIVVGYFVGRLMQIF